MPGNRPLITYSRKRKHSPAPSSDGTAFVPSSSQADASSPRSFQGNTASQDPKDLIADLKGILHLDFNHGSNTAEVQMLRQALPRNTFDQEYQKRFGRRRLSSSTFEETMPSSPPNALFQPSGDSDDSVNLEDFSNPFGLDARDREEIASRYDGEPRDDASRPIPTSPASQSSAVSFNAAGMTTTRLRELDPTGLLDRDEQAAKLRQALDRGVRPFIEVVCENELACSTLRGAQLEHTLHEVYMATISIHREILDGLIDGTLVSKCADSSTTEGKIVAELKERVDSVAHPGVYQQGIATPDGVSPTTIEHQKALKDVYSYCFGKKPQDQVLAHTIDSMMEPHTSFADIQRGVRKYLRNHEELPIERRKQAASTFCKVLSNALQKVPAEDQHNPHKHVLVEFGFSSTLVDRLRQHRKHTSSNFLMNLYHACLTYRHGNRYILHQNVIALCARPQYATLLEILANRSGGGYVTSGWGLSHYPAGRSVPLGRRTVQQWAEYFRWIKEHTQLEENHQREVERIKTEEAREEMERIELNNELQQSAVGKSLAGLLRYVDEHK
ncbi:hypothetical protein KC349_g1261 [Hortaea werneckii]|nr:hypothetical protein KC349_g1261 [Hortaea werneckii]